MAAPVLERDETLLTKTRLVRLGNWHLELPEYFQAEASKDLVDRIVRRLDSDPRVTRVTPPDIDDYWTRSEIRYPYTVDGESDAVLDGSDRYHVLRMSGPIIFDVQVPIKNQPTHHGADDIPTDRCPGNSRHDALAGNSRAADGGRRREPLYLLSGYVLQAWRLSSDNGRSSDFRLNRTIPHSCFLLVTRETTRRKFPACEQRE